MPRTIRRFGAKLLDQQFWCWGRDVDCTGSNLLLRFGFERHRDCETEERSTCYRFDHDQLHVALWGFGMFFGRRDLGGLFVERFDFCPNWAPIESLSLAIHWPDDLPTFGRPLGRTQWHRARNLWESLLHWVAEYEKWIVATAGIDHRRQCVESWLRPLVRADRMAEAWQFLSRRGWESQNQPLQQRLKRYTLPIKSARKIDWEHLAGSP